MSDLSRSAALLGDVAMRRLAAAKVAVIGVGGVGSWCAEALIRTGIGRLALVDDDVVATSNVNRQCPATSETIGRPKVEAMRERLLSIDPSAEVIAVAGRYPDSVGGFKVEDFTCIVDAIDSVESKAELVRAAIEAKVPIVSSMGAANRMDPTKVTIRRFDKVEGDGLARALRQRFRRMGMSVPKFTCVCSTELPRQKAGKGSVMPVTCAFGMALAAEVIRIASGDDI